MPSALITRVFLAISILGCSLTVLRLLLSGLCRRYQVFTWFFAFRALYDLWPLLLPPKSDTYFYFFIITEPIIRLFCIFAVLELYRLALQRYKGLYTLGRWVMYGASLISVIVSVLMLLPHITPTMPQKSMYLGYAYGFNRGVDFSLTIFILLMLIFLSRYPITLSRNLVVHASLYSIYFLSSGTYGFVRRAIGGGSANTLNLVFSGIVAACTVAWFFLLTPEGEGVKAARIRFSPEYETRMLEKLDALNQMMLNSGKVKILSSVNLVPEPNDRD
jgi:hypothetical protein